VGAKVEKVLEVGLVVVGLRGAVVVSTTLLVGAKVVGEGLEVGVVVGCKGAVGVLVRLR
jgi:hypothetical protein